MSSGHRTAKNPLLVVVKQPTRAMLVQTGFVCIYVKYECNVYLCGLVVRSSLSVCLRLCTCRFRVLCPQQFVSHWRPANRSWREQLVFCNFALVEVNELWLQHIL